jgi:hypothetical protein
VDFSHWNMALDFSLFEVACLACGIEPNENVNDPRVKSIERLLNDAYLRCRTTCWSILQQNDRDLLDGKEQTYPAYYADAFESWSELPSRDVRWSFAEALKDPENCELISMHEDRMRFGRDDLEVYFKDCDFEPSVILYDAIRRPTSQNSADASNSREGKSIEYPLATRERNTLLTMIAILCKESKMDYTKPAKTAALMKDMAARMGLEIGETTIEQHLKKIPDAIGSRMK